MFLVWKTEAEKGQCQRNKIILQHVNPVEKV